MKWSINKIFRSSRANSIDFNEVQSKDLSEVQKRHLSTMIDCVKPHNKVGLEIGPLDRPFIDKSEYDVFYVDYFNEQQLQKKIENTPNRNPDNIVKLDYVLEGERLIDVVDRKFDYVFSSHVLEHLPDLLGWLNDLTKILNPGGMLFSVIPDCRYCFDIERPQTSLGELIENNELKLGKPSQRHVFDQWFYHKKVNPHALWNDYDKHKNSVPRSFTLNQSYKRSLKAEEKYIDCHVNTFTPDSFKECIVASKELGLHEFDLKKVTQTQHRTLDFSILLELPD